MHVTLTDDFWAPRQEQLRTHTLPVMLERLEASGTVANFRRSAEGNGEPFRAMHFADSDLYKWLEAAVLAGRDDLADPVIDLVVAVQQPDGYVHTHFGTDGCPPRYSDMAFGHEQYCHGHLIEAAVSHWETTGSDRLLGVAVRLADHLLATFGPGRDERTDSHPEVELALARLGAATGDERYVAHAAWIIEAQLERVDLTLEDHRWSGHAVRAIYLASGIAEVALATGSQRWVDAATRLYASLLDQHSYPTGAVGGRWLGEAVGKPYELPDAMAYAESCAAVAAVQLSRRMWRLTADPRALDQIELLEFNAVPCGVGSDGESWFYSQPHAVAEVAAETNPWMYGFEYGQVMLLEWFPTHRHEWFDVPCCPPNLARLFASVDRDVCEVDAAGDLYLHLPIAARITGDGWDVEVTGSYPTDGDVQVRVHAAPPGRVVRTRRPGWAGGDGHEVLDAGAGAAATWDLPVRWEWWRSARHVEGAAGQVHLRRGPVVHCVEGAALDHAGMAGADLRDLVVVDASAGPDTAFALRRDVERLYGPVPDDHRAADVQPVALRTTPYAEWANRGTTTMRTRFPLA